MSQTHLLDDEEKLRQSLGELPEPVVKPCLVVVSGLPGTGKSYFSRRLAQRIPLVILESDALRKVMFPSPSYTQEESTRLFQATHRLIETLLKKGISLVLDATNLQEPHRERLYNISERVGAKLIMVRVEAPDHVVQQRIADRGMNLYREDKSEATWAVYQRMKGTSQVIRRNHFAVDTSRDIDPVVQKIVREINR
ncbi:MAG: ATP-binding protein [Chloroflexota bacterium]|nr:ATP-binding protein [Chloroflexota bacterium]